LVSPTAKLPSPQGNRMNGTPGHFQDSIRRLRGGFSLLQRVPRVLPWAILAASRREACGVWPSDRTKGMRLGNRNVHAITLPIPGPQKRGTGGTLGEG
jgi:hypothetical protein